MHIYFTVAERNTASSPQHDDIRLADFYYAPLSFQAGMRIEFLVSSHLPHYAILKSEEFKTQTLVQKYLSLILSRVLNL